MGIVSFTGRKGDRMGERVLTLEFEPLDKRRRVSSHSSRRPNQTDRHQDMRPDPPIPQRSQYILLHPQLLPRVFLGRVVVVYAGDEDLAFSSVEQAEFGEEERRGVRRRGGEDGREEE
jgi:hypothetical protein